MNAVREWTAGICVAALAAAVLQGMVPNGAMERMFRLVMGAFMVCVLILPLQKLVPKLSAIGQGGTSAQEQTRLEGAVTQQYQDAAQQSIRNLVFSELGRMNIKCEKVVASMDIKEDNSIVINRVKVVLAAEEASKCQKVAAELEKTLGLKMEVTANAGR